jgi:hypothetical protein
MLIHYIISSKACAEPFLRYTFNRLIKLLQLILIHLTNK